MLSESDKYLLEIVQKYKLPDEIDFYTSEYVVKPLKNIVSAWANQYLVDIKLSGSMAKGDATILSSDLDLFISLSSTTPCTLQEIYESLYDYVSTRGISSRKQNVSIGVTYKSKKIDLVPAKRWDSRSNDHSLYKRKQDSWTKTNIDVHINDVKRSSRVTEIIALKIWKELHKLEFPSIYLEKFVLDALSGRNRYDYANNFVYLLTDIADNFESRRVIDSANTANILSDDLTIAEKRKIAQQARIDLTKRWNQVIW